jgi:hypothetical protein
LEWHVVVADGGSGEGGGGVEVVGAREGDGVVAVLALVGGDDDGGVVGGALHPLLHRALAVGAPVVAPAGTCIIRNLIILEFNFQSFRCRCMYQSSAVPFGLNFILFN